MHESLKTSSRRAIFLAALLPASAWAGNASLKINSLPSAAPVLGQPGVPQTGLTLPTLQLPGVQHVLSAQLPVAPQAPVTAQAHLDALNPQSERMRAENRGAAGASYINSMVYDGMMNKLAAEPTPAPSVAADYTAAPAEIPLARLSPAWSQAVLPVAGSKTLPQRKPGKNKPVDLGSEETLSAKDDIRRISGTAPSSLSSRDAVTYFESKAFEIPGAKQIALRKNTVVWVDAEGKLNAYDFTDKKATKFTGPMGEVESFVLAENGMLYAAGGGTIQRWDLDSGDAVVLLDERFSTAGGVTLKAGATGVEFSVASGRYAWADGRLATVTSEAESVAPEPLQHLNGASAWRAQASETELWRSGLAGWSFAGSAPVKAEATAVSKDGSYAYLLAGGALYQWEVDGGRYRKLDVPGLDAAAVGPKTVLQTTDDGGKVFVSAGERFFLVDTKKESAEVSGPEGRVRLWSEQNPMFVRDGMLHIGEFTFPIGKRYGRDTRSALRKFVDRVLRRAYVPAELPLEISEKNWRALNLPSNKWNLYQTLRSFSLGQHVMYVGETGGGKTWLADVIAQITNNELWMVSLTEYTRNQDLIARDTFGEEGKNKTGLSMSVVLKWLQNGGILLLDEMHKPLEGVAALNNILQNLEYRMPDGRVIKGDPKKCFVIGTMNPVKPPYKGEPPSGELESRFGSKLRVNYLPPAEEAALLQIFRPTLGEKMAKALIKIANELRRSYPDVLPLPISSRTLLHIVNEIAAFPNDDPVEIFKVKYNPMALLDDPSIGHAIDKALQAHDLRGAANNGAEKKTLK